MSVSVTITIIPYVSQDEVCGLGMHNATQLHI